MAVRVLHCDDSDAFRLLVREMLSDEDGIDVVGEAADADAAVAVGLEQDPDVVLLDLRGGDLGPEVIERVAHALPRAKIVVLSGWAGPIDESRLAARLGKDIEFSELAATIHRVVALP